MTYQYSRSVRSQVVNRFHTPQQGGVRHVRGPYSRISFSFHDIMIWGRIAQ